MSTSFDPLKQGADAPILFSLEGHVAVLTLNRPATRNALSGEEMFRAFETIFDYINQNTQVRASVLTGAGTAFCSGGNITEMKDKTGMFRATLLRLQTTTRTAFKEFPEHFKP